MKLDLTRRSDISECTRIETDVGDLTITQKQSSTSMGQSSKEMNFLKIAINMM